MSTKKYILKPTYEKKTPTDFKIDYQKELNQEQLKVVTHKKGGPMLVIAGAGSGKTRAVTYRVAWLVENNVPLDRILLSTFTNKAASEMVRRVEDLLEMDLKKLWAGTFHSLANRILRRHAQKIGYQSNFAILDETDAKELMNLSVNLAGINTKSRRFPKGDILKSILSYGVNARVKVEEAIALKYPHFSEEVDEIKKVFDVYGERKVAENLMDFDDLLVNWNNLLRDNDDVREYYARKFLYVLVDEYQDTNLIQAEIIDQLASLNHNLMVVGDDSQSIYSFRAARFKNIIDFPKRYPKTEIFKLETNHRSTPEILKLANENIKNAKYKFEKELKPVKKSGSKPVIIPTPDVYEQAQFVSQRILELRDENVPLGEMAVLYRSHYHSLELQLELTRRGIPFVVRSGLRFFEEAHIKDLLSYLKVFHNNFDEISWKRIFKTLPGVGPATMSKLWEYLRVTSDPIKAIENDEILSLIPSRGKESFAEFMRFFPQLKGFIASPAAMLEKAYEELYADYLKNTFQNYEERREDLKQFKNYAANYDTLEAFLSDLALVGGIASEDVVKGKVEDDESLVLSSVHQAKGLEWSRVFIVWLVDGRFPSARSLGDPESEEEERRLFYVAVTRAKDETYLIYPLTSRDSYYGAGLLFRPSRYLTELSDHLYEIWEIEEEDDEEGEYNIIDVDEPEWVN